MAGYSTSTPPILVTQGMTSTYPRVWMLYGTDAVATVQVTGYITNGGDLGMKAGDLLLYVDTDTFLSSTLYVKTVSSTAPGAVDLADPTTVGSSTNSD